MDEKKKCLGRNSLLSGPSLTWGSSSGQNSMWRLISVHACMLSCVQFFAILWTVARQAPPSVRFPGRNTRVGCYSLLLRIFSTQGSNPCHLRLLHWQADSLSLSHLGDWYSEYFKIVSEVRPIASLSEFQSSIHLPLLPEDCSFSPGTSVLGQSSFYGWIFWSRVECQKIDAFELWCWRRLLRVPWTARRSNQTILKEISPGCSVEGLMLKLKLQYFGHLM